MRFLRVSFLVAIVLAVSGCGSDTRAVGSIPDGAEFAPASAPVYVWASTDPDGEQWQAGAQLLARFPGSELLFAEARKHLEDDGLTWERDVVPALPKDVNAVWLDFENDGSNFVVYLKPGDEAKFNELLDSSDDAPVRRKIDGWTVLAEKAGTIDRFEAARRAGSLADEDSFSDAMEKLPDDAAARGWVSGESVQAALEREAAGGGDAQSFRQFSESFGTLKSVTFAGTAQDDGVKVEAAYEAEDGQQVENFSAELDDALPAGALAYVSFGSLKELLEDFADKAESSAPEFESQLKQMEQALGFSLKADLFPLLSKEGAIAVYRNLNELEYPNVLLALSVPDEAKAKKMIDRLSALAGVSGMTTRPFTVAGAEGKELVIPEAGISIFAVVADGKALVSTDKSSIEDALGDATKLADDVTYQEAREAAGAPDETAGFVYVNLKAGLPYIFEFADQEESEAIPPEVRENTEPLQSVLLYAEQDGDRTSVSGFLTIK